MDAACVPHFCRRTGRDSGGFTLIELIVVIVIIGVLVGFVVMSMNRRSPDDVGVCREQMQSWLAGQAVVANLQGSVVYIQNTGPTPSAFVLSAPVIEQDKAAAGPRSLQPKVISNLFWAKGCSVETPAKSTDYSALDPSDPRLRALLAVTADGVWSASPYRETEKPAIVVRGQDQQTQTIDLSSGSGEGEGK
jgi:prepilin-type N-terminal cleavage/methylation domain-containing protein